MTVGAPVRAGTGSEWSITCGGNWLKKHKLGLVVVSLLLIFLEWIELATIQKYVYTCTLEQRWLQRLCAPHGWLRCFSHWT